MAESLNDTGSGGGTATNPDLALLARATLQGPEVTPHPDPSLLAVSALATAYGIGELRRLLVSGHSLADVSLDMLRAQAAEGDHILPAHILQGSRVAISLCDPRRIKDLEVIGQSVRLPFDRLLVLIAHGDGTFDLEKQYFGEGLVPDEQERFGRGDAAVQIGAPVFKSRGAVALEEACRLHEGLAVGCEGTAVELGVRVFSGAEATKLVVTKIEVNEQQVMPPLA